MPISTGLQPFFQNVPLMVPGVPLFLLGSKSKDTSPTYLNITTIASSVNTVTIGATITAGAVPTAAQLLTVQNASVAGIDAVSATVTNVTGFSGGGYNATVQANGTTITATTGVFNTGWTSQTVYINGVPYVTASVTSTTVLVLTTPYLPIAGIVTNLPFNSGDNSTGTIQYTVTGVGSLATTAGSGQVVMPVVPVPDVCANESSIYAALPFNDPRIDQSRTLVFQCFFPSLPTTATITAYVSDDGITFYSIGAIATVAAGVMTGGLLEVSAQSAAFVQVQVASVTGGTLPTVWCMVSA